MIRKLRVAFGLVVLVSGVMTTVFISGMMLIGPAVSVWDEPLGKWTGGDLVIGFISMALSPVVAFWGIVLSFIVGNKLMGK